MRTQTTAESRPSPADLRPAVRRVGLLALVGLAVLLPSCTSDGNFCILGYDTKPNYDTSIRTVRVPVFRNLTVWTVTPVPGMEADLTAAVVREIEARTPYKVVTECADSELLGVIVGFTKLPLNHNQLNYARELETNMVIEVVWRRLPDGEPLSRPARRPGQPRPFERPAPLFPEDELAMNPSPSPRVNIPNIPTPLGDPFGPVTRPDGGPLPRSAGRERVVPITLRSTAHFRPELGESITTAMQRNINDLAVRITEAMEMGW